MYIYAQLNKSGKVVGVSSLSGEVIAGNMINITELTKYPELGSLYITETQSFQPPESIPSEIIPTIEEKILAENQYQTMLLELNTLGGA
ncbi:hypothetical protein [Lysinibacillus sp. FSL W8-0992]|uniref:hypothetical protein n=1 Tax=Lysinibacillus sp. FSL W8-0992 TaxID=2954643 RepID=UPI0030FCAD6E